MGLHRRLPAGSQRRPGGRFQPGAVRHPGVNIGLWCLTPIMALSRTVMPKHATLMPATGRLYDAQFALRVGLVNDVVEPKRLAETVKALAAEIASKSTYTLALGKQAFYRQL
nr:enoyl-CoA hydratase-related protein [Bradyrhizobium campsiandrae]